MKNKKQQATSLEKIEISKRNRDILKLRLSGLSLQDIGDAVGITASAVHKVITKELALITVGPAKDLKIQELLKLDTLQAALWPQAMTGCNKSINTLLKLAERRSKLLGLDAETNQNINISSDSSVRLEHLQAIKDLSNVQDPNILQKLYATEIQEK